MSCDNWQIKDLHGDIWLVKGGQDWFGSNSPVYVSPRNPDLYPTFHLSIQSNSLLHNNESSTDIT